MFYSSYRRGDQDTGETSRNRDSTLLADVLLKQSWAQYAIHGGVVHHAGYVAQNRDLRRWHWEK